MEILRLHYADDYISEFNKLVATGKGSRDELKALLKSFESSGWGRKSNWSHYFAKSRNTAGKTLFVLTVLTTAANAAEESSSSGNSSEFCSDFANAFSLEVIVNATNADLARLAIEKNSLTQTLLEVRSREDAEMHDALNWENNTYWQNQLFIESHLK
jgi:hypothetical protein